MIIKYFILLFFIPNMKYTSATHNIGTSTNANKFLGIYPIPPKTPGAININTNKVIKAKLTPFTFSASVGEKLKVVNTGKSIEIYAGPITFSTIRGGPFLEETYNLHSIKLYWTNNCTHLPITTLDGLSPQIVVEVYYYNQKYLTFDNAIKYSDGVGQVNIPGKIGIIPNPFFPSFANILRKIEHPGSSATTTLRNAIKWYDFLNPNSEYYTYPGSYLDEKTGQTYDSTTTVVYPLSTAFSLSKEQFKSTFGSFFNGEAIPGSKVEPSKAPIVEAVGTQQIFFEVKIVHL